MLFASSPVRKVSDLQPLSISKLLNSPFKIYIRSQKVFKNMLGICHNVTKKLPGPRIFKFFSQLFQKYPLVHTTCGLKNMLLSTV